MNFTRRCLRRLLVVGGLSLFLGLPAALAVHDLNLFELDGNAVDSPSGAPDDWSELYNSGANDGGSSGATAFTGIVSDKNGVDDYFTGGGSKTPNLINEWQYKNAPPSGPPDKDNITHAYAANYIKSGEQIVYFGADLFSNNGDAELGFWFFQAKVSKKPISGNTGGFNGAHVDGDPYIAVKFSNGGTQADIAVYEWDSSCTKPPGSGPFPAGGCAADNLRVVIEEGPATCSGGLLDDEACAISNPGGSVIAPWPYTPKSGSAGSFPPTTFFEGGINIKEVFGQNLCFSSFMATTGASTSFTSTAKDFVLNNFDVCSVAASKTCVNDTEADDTPAAITYNVRGCGINDGGGAINITTLENSIGGGTKYTPADLQWYVPGMVDPGGGARDFNASTDCDDAGLLAQAITNGTGPSNPASVDLGPGEALVYLFSETTAVNGATDTVTIDAEGTDGSPIDADTDTATCPARTFDTGINVTKQCAADLEDAGSNVVVKINIEGQVCNTGEVALTNLALTDDADVPTGVTVTFVLDPNDVHTNPDTTLSVGDCVDYSASYYPASIPTGDICPFMDQATATVLAPINTSPTGGTSCTPVTGGFECTADSNSATCNLRAVDGDGDCSTGPLSPLP